MLDIIEKLEIEKQKWINKIYGVGETRIDLMLDDVIRTIKNERNELETYKKIINTTINYVLNNTHIEHDGDDYGYTEWIEIDTDTTTFITTLKNILENEVLKDE